MNNNEITIIFGGDVFPGGKVLSAFTGGLSDEIFHDLSDEIKRADLSVANLECPLVTNGTPITKAGVVLSAPQGAMNGLVAAGFSLLNLANNHSFDHGTVGLRETIQSLKKSGLQVVGAGFNLREAQAPFVKEINGRKITIYAMAEREFSFADEKTPGANPLDIIDFVKVIRDFKREGVFIVLIHGGKEYYPYPTPETVRRCRFMIEMGADAVICCHAHCPLPWEIFAGRPIIYGLGNLIFEAESTMADSWYEGYLARVIIQGNSIRFEAIPYFQSKGTIGARKMSRVEALRFQSEMGRRSGQIADPEFVEAQWTQYCLQQKRAYLSALFGYNGTIGRLKRKMLSLLHPRESLLQALHLVQCETHQEILNTIFKNERSLQ